MIKICNMKKMYLIVVPSADGRTVDKKIVTSDLSLVTGKYPFFTVESVEVVE